MIWERIPRDPLGLLVPKEPNTLNHNIQAPIIHAYSLIKGIGFSGSVNGSRVLAIRDLTHARRCSSAPQGVQRTLNLRKECNASTNLES